MMYTGSSYPAQFGKARQPSSSGGAAGGSISSREQPSGISIALPSDPATPPLYSPNLLRLINLIMLVNGVVVGGIYNLLIMHLDDKLLPSIFALVALTLLAGFVLIFAERYYGISVTLTLVIIIALSMYATATINGLGVDPELFNAMWALPIGAFLYGQRGLIISATLIVGSFILLTLLDKVGIMPAPHLDSLDTMRADIVISFFIIFVIMTLLFSYALWAYTQRENRWMIIENRLTRLEAGDALLSPPDAAVNQMASTREAPLYSPSLLQFINLVIMLIGFAIAGVYNLIVAPISDQIGQSLFTLVVVTLMTAFSLIYARRYYGLSLTLTLIIIVAIAMYATASINGFAADPSVFNALWVLLLGTLLYGRRGLVIAATLIVGSFLLLTILDRIGLLPTPQLKNFDDWRASMIINFFLFFIVNVILLGYFLWASSRRTKRHLLIESRLIRLEVESAPAGQPVVWEGRGSEGEAHPPKL